MNLLDWLQKKKKVEPKIAADIISQLLIKTYKKVNIEPINPKYIEITESDESDFKDIIFVQSSDTYCDLFAPANRNEGYETGNVFVAGLILHSMLSGNDTDFSNLDLLDGADDESNRWLTMPNTNLDGLLKKMTVLDPDKRCDSNEVFRYISEKFSGAASIVFKEVNSDSIISIVEYKLDNAETILNENDIITFNEQKFFPVLRNCFFIPFRIKVISYEIPVTVDDTYSNKIYSLNSDKNEKFYGIDFGRRSVKISCINNNGELTENILPIHSVAAIDFSGQLLFGKEAEKLVYDSKAEIIEIFSDEYSEDDVITVSDKSGNPRSIAKKELINKFILFVKNQMTDIMGYNDQFIVTVCVSDNEYGKFCKLISAGMKQCGMFVKFISSYTASMLNCYATEKTDGKTMFVSSGTDSTEICIFDEWERLEKSNISNLKLTEANVFSVSGGNEFTRIVYEILLSRLKNQYNLNMYSENNSGMSVSKYLRNNKEVYRIAEKIKKRLSFEDEVTEKAELYCDESRTFNFTVSRAEYESKIISVTDKLVNAINVCVKNSSKGIGYIKKCVLIGGSAVTPLIKKEIKKFFSDTDCIIQNDYNVFWNSEGAAIYSIIYDDLNSKEIKNILGKDIGYAVIDSVKGIPVFNSLISANTEYEDGAVSATYCYRCDNNDMKKHSGELKIYMRERGHNDIDSLYDGDGIIKYIGKIIFELPEKFNRDKDIIKLHIKIDNTGKIVVNAFFEKNMGFINMISKKVKFFKNSVEKLPINVRFEEKC